MYSSIISHSVKNENYVPKINVHSIFSKIIYIKRKFSYNETHKLKQAKNSIKSLSM